MEDCQLLACCFFFKVSLVYLNFSKNDLTEDFHYHILITGKLNFGLQFFVLITSKVIGGV